jgi:hypothetical protein
MRDTNRLRLISTVRLLSPLLDDLVFVGGCITGLLITDDAAPAVRSTGDVDAIAEITSYAAYVRFSDRLRQLGFVEDVSEGAPLCRWRHGEEAILDVMPLDREILGFSNRWYRDAMNAAQVVALEPALHPRVITAPFFIATKLEAFKSRGRRDYLASHDLEDVIAVIDGRSELIEEVRSAQRALRAYLSIDLSALVNDPHFIDALPAHLPSDQASQARLPILLERIEELMVSQ